MKKYAKAKAEGSYEPDTFTNKSADDWLVEIEINDGVTAVNPEVKTRTREALEVMAVLLRKSGGVVNVKLVHAARAQAPARASSATRRSAWTMSRSHSGRGGQEPLNGCDLGVGLARATSARVETAIALTHCWNSADLV